MQVTTDEMINKMHLKWRWLLAVGIVFVLLGLIGLGASFALTMMSMLFFGVLLLIGGGYQLVDAFRYSGWSSRLSHVLIAVLYVFAGIFMVNDPLAASSAFTLVISAILMSVGILRIFMSFQMRQFKGWFWILLSGIVTLALGGMIMAQLPSSALWVIGMIIAVEMMFSGWSMIIIALASRETE